MAKYLLHILVILLVLFLAGCEKEKGGMIDPNYAVPFLAAASLSATAVDIDTDTTGAVVRLDSTTYRVTIGASGTVVGQPGDPPSSAGVLLTRPGEQSAFQSASFAVHHVAADSFAFSGSVSFVIHSTDLGLLRLSFSATSAA